MPAQKPHGHTPQGHSHGHSSHGHSSHGHSHGHNVHHGGGHHAPPTHQSISKPDQQDGDDCCTGCCGDTGSIQSWYGEDKEACCYCVATNLFRLFCFSFFGVCIRLPIHPRKHKAPGPDKADYCDLVSVCCNGGMC